VKVFLTGATGYIGQPLTKALLARGWNVTALVRHPEKPKAQALVKMGAQLATGDVTDRESMRDEMEGADIVIHNAGIYEYGVNGAGKKRMHAVNILGTENVLGLAHELKIQRTLYVSTVQAFGESGNSPKDETFTRQTPCRTCYGHTKTAAHQTALSYREQGLPLIIICPNGVIGANDHSPFGYFLRLYINHVMPPLCWSPDSLMSLVYIDDLVTGIVLASENGTLGEDYLLCGEVRSFREHLAFWEKKPGGFKPLIWLSGKMAHLLFTPLEAPQRWFGLPSFMSRETAIGASTNWYYSCEKAKRELGWTHRSAEAMWNATIEDELTLLNRRESQNLIQRLKPLDMIN
jgi:nucleoside-diphosphate-sugar epimerase